MVQHKNNAEHQRTYRYKNYQNYSRQLLINRISKRKAYHYEKPRLVLHYTIKILMLFVG